jgi:hypothetical protein
MYPASSRFGADQQIPHNPLATSRKASGTIISQKYKKEQLSSKSAQLQRHYEGASSTTDI